MEPGEVPTTEFRSHLTETKVPKSGLLARFVLRSQQPHAKSRQEVHRYGVHNTPPLSGILGQMSPASSLKPNFSKMQVHFVLPLLAVTLPERQQQEVLATDTALTALTALANRKETF
jgi:hypothetical protein